MVHWWNLRVCWPAVKAGSGLALVQKVEGTTLLPTPAGLTSSAASSSTDRQRSNNGRANRGRPGPKNNSSQPYFERFDGKGNRGGPYQNQAKGKKGDNQNKGNQKGGGKNSKGDSKGSSHK